MQEDALQRDIHRATTAREFVPYIIAALDDNAVESISESIPGVIASMRNVLTAADFELPSESSEHPRWRNSFHAACRLMKEEHLVVFVREAWQLSELGEGYLKRFKEESERQSIATACQVQRD